jgi:hypothetical protein
VTTATLAPTVTKALQSADPETRNEAAQVAVDLESHDLPTAFARIDELASRPELKPEQRAELNRARMAALKQLQADVTAGDANAARAVRRYMSSR